MWAAHSSDLRPVLVGEGWQHIAPAELEARWVDHGALAELYASTDVLLVDHWQDMREHGFISNRVFDALAAGCAVVCDRVAGLDEQFPGEVETFATPGELRDAVERFRQLGDDARGAPARAGR